MFFGLVSFAARANKRELDALGNGVQNQYPQDELSLRLCMFRVAL
jgi:hypothetical protein